MDWTRGYSPAELTEIQARFKLKFPPDLIELYLERRLIKGTDWLGPEAEVRAMLQWPLEGLLFDLRHNDLWLEQWGKRPDALSDQEFRVAELVREAPKLIPIYSHRFLPEFPQERGNPVLSVYQSDIIYYGANLDHYFAVESDTIPYAAPWPAIKRIPFWSDLIDE